jgi:hypothetical protein
VADFLTGFRRFPDWPFMAANRQGLDNGNIGELKENLRGEKQKSGGFTPPDLCLN